MACRLLVVVLYCRFLSWRWRGGDLFSFPLTISRKLNFERGVSKLKLYEINRSFLPAVL